LEVRFLGVLGDPKMRVRADTLADELRADFLMLRLPWKVRCFALERERPTAPGSGDVVLTRGMDDRNADN